MVLIRRIIFLLALFLLLLIPIHALDLWDPDPSKSSAQISISTSNVGDPATIDYKIKLNDGSIASGATLAVFLPSDIQGSSFTQTNSYVVPEGWTFPDGSSAAGYNVIYVKTEANELSGFSEAQVSIVSGVEINNAAIKTSVAYEFPPPADWAISNPANNAETYFAPILVTFIAANQPPVWPELSNISLLAGETKSVPLTATDSDNDPLTYSASTTMPLILEIQEISGVYNLLVTADISAVPQNGTIELIANDSKTTSPYSLGVSIAPPSNLPPELRGYDKYDEKVTVGSVYESIGINFSDPNGDQITPVLRAELSYNLCGETLVSISSDFKLKVDSSSCSPSDIGTRYTYYISAIDPEGLSSQEFNYTAEIVSCSPGTVIDACNVCNDQGNIQVADRTVVVGRIPATEGEKLFAVPALLHCSDAIQRTYPNGLWFKMLQFYKDNFNLVPQIYSGYFKRNDSYYMNTLFYDIRNPDISQTLQSAELTIFSLENVAMPVSLAPPRVGNYWDKIDIAGLGEVPPQEEPTVGDIIFIPPGAAGGDGGAGFGGAGGGGGGGGAGGLPVDTPDNWTYIAGLLIQIEETPPYNDTYIIIPEYENLTWPLPPSVACTYGPIIVL